MPENKETQVEEEVLPAQTADEIIVTDTEDDHINVKTIRTKSDVAFDVFDFLEMLIIAACAIMLIFSFVARLSTVDGASMIGTLEHGDKLIVSDLFYTPDQGDIVIFHDLDNAVFDTAIVKRIIAVGGQTVKLTYTPQDNLNVLTITVDDVPLDEPYRYYDASAERELKYRYEGTHTYVVPEGCVFVMGDNTYNSEDSRGIFGYVDEDKIVGRVVFRVCGKDLSSLFTKFGTVK